MTRTFLQITKYLPNLIAVLACTLDCGSECKTPEIRERTTPSSLKLSERIARKYKRLRARPSPLKDHVRRRLLANQTEARDY